MKTTTLVTLIATILTVGINAQTLEWAKSFGGQNFDAGRSIAIDSLENVYITGSFSDTADFDPGIGTYNLISKGNHDIFISKLDASGNLIWAKQMGGTGLDQSLSIALDNYGNIYITGSFEATVDFNPNLGIFNLNSAGGADIFVCKIDSAGNFIWAKQFGGSGYDHAPSIAVDASGNTYITGNFEDIVDFDPNSGVFNLNSAGGADIFVCKIDSAGNFIWANKVGGKYQDEVNSIAVNQWGSIYITGSFQDTVDFDPGINTYNLISEHSFDAFVSKLDTLGNFLWAKQFGGIGLQYGKSITTDNSGNVYTTGRFQDTVDFNPGTGVFDMISISYNQDIFISKLDASGNFVWAKQIGGLSGGQSNSIIIDAAENVYTTGFFGSTVDFDPGSGTYNLTSVGTTDIFISKLNASGDFVWAKHMGGVGVSIGNKISLDVSGNIYTIGSFQDTVDFDPNSGISNLIAAGSWDVFVQKMSQTISEIRENFNDSQIRFYPNPTNGLIHITFESEPSQVQIIVRNIMGQELYRKKHSATKHIDLILDGPAGVYLIEVSTVNKRALLKVIKE